MDFSTTTRPYIWAFYFLGLSSARPADIESENSSSRAMQKVPSILHTILGFTVSISIIIAIAYTNRDPLFYGRSEYTFIVTIASCDILRTISVLIQCIFYKSLIIEIISTFQQIDSIFTIHFQYEISYKNLWKTYTRKMSLMVCAFLQAVIIIICRSILYNTFIPHAVQMKLLQIQTAATFLHIIFYIEVLSFYIDQLAYVVDNNKLSFREESVSILMARNSRNYIRIRNKLNSIKIVHFRLYEVSKKINNLFGWCMVVLFLHVFISTVHSAYWLFDLLQRTWAPLRFIRKWKI